MTTELKHFIGDRVRHHRLEASMTQSQLASAVGMTRTNISKIENQCRPLAIFEVRRFELALKLDKGALLVPLGEWV